MTKRLCRLARPSVAYEPFELLNDKWGISSGTWPRIELMVHPGLNPPVDRTLHLNNELRK